MAPLIIFWTIYTIIAVLIFSLVLKIVASVLFKRSVSFLSSLLVITLLVVTAAGIAGLFRLSANLYSPLNILTLFLLTFGLFAVLVHTILKSQNILKTGLTVLVAFVGFVVSAYFLLTTIYEYIKPYAVAGNSMAPTLVDGQFFLARMTTDVSRGDVVIFKYPAEPTKIHVQRLVAIPGDQVTVKEKTLYVNGRPALRPYVEDINLAEDFKKTMLVDEYFLVGDNQEKSSDSFDYGAVTKSLIIGRAASLK